VTFDAEDFVVTFTETSWGIL